MSVRECIKRIYAKSGVRGFYKGITASYFGISETVIHFVIYEALKAKLVSFINFIQYSQLNVIIFIFPFSSSRFGILHFQHCQRSFVTHVLILVELNYMNLPFDGLMALKIDKTNEIMSLNRLSFDTNIH